MASSSQSQISAATVLVQLITEYPDLAEHMSWMVNRTNPTLVGYIHDGGMQVLAGCAEFLGGSVKAADHTFRRGDQQMRQHVLTTTWRDVPVEVLLSLPVAAEAVAA